MNWEYYNRRFYINGNYVVNLEYDQIPMVKKRALRSGEELISDFPDSIDLKITNKCSWGCSFCHESSTRNGDSFDLKRTVGILNQLPSVPIEIAIGGGNVMECCQSDLVKFLIWAREKKYFRTRITINEKDLESLLSPEKSSILGSIGGLGISISTFDLSKPDTFYLIEHLTNDFSLLPLRENVVLHIIAGIFPVENLRDLLSSGQRVLILGYKQWGRAKGTQLPETLKETEEIVKETIDREYRRIIRPGDTGPCTTIAFDNLAIEQLHLREYIPTHIWNMYYQGDEGEHSMYIDAVKGEFARTSRSEHRESWDNIGLLEFFRNLRDDKYNY